MLALLLIEANKIVSVRRIIDAVWGATPPATADKQIQTCVWRLRSAFENAGAPAGLIETAPGGYLLRIDDDHLDARVFEKMVQRGRSRAEEGDLAGAVEDYRAALGLFAGSPLAELSSPAIEAFATYWEERRLSVLEECLDIELAMGRHRETVSELRLLVAEYPLREQLRAQLMTALYLSQRRADALAVYRAGRATLVNNLGLDPGARLQDLHRRIIAGHAVSLAQPQRARRATKVPAQLPADVADFTGRLDHLGWLERELSADRADGPRIVALVGRGGVGKTALAVHAAHRLRDRFPDGQLHADLRGSTRPVPPMEALGGLLGSLGVPERAMPDILDARAALYRSIVAGKRLLVFLDDAANCAQVEPLLPGSNDVAVLCTSQSSMIEMPGVAELRVDGLDTDDAVRLLTRVVTPDRVAREPESARLIVELCGHLPLAIRAAGARLRARPTYRLDRFVDRLADEDRRFAELTYGSLDPGVRLISGAERLSAGAHRLWLLLSLPTLTSVPAWAAAVVAAVPEDEAQRLLDNIVEHQLLDVVGEDVLGGSRYAFHPLVRIRARQRADADLDRDTRDRAVRQLIDVFCWLEAQARGLPSACPDGTPALPEPVARIARAVLGEVAPRADAWLAQERANLVRLGESAIVRPRQAGGDGWPKPRNGQAAYGRRSA